MSKSKDSFNLNLCIYIVFHNSIFEHLYEEMSQEDKKYLVLYGVREKVKTNMSIIYEKNLIDYNPKLQKDIYNEGSAFYHIYKNSHLYKNYDYIGFGQYDMKIFNNTISNIKNIIQTSKEEPIIVFDYFPDIKETGFLGAHNLIHSNLNNLECGLTTYNRMFGTNYTPYDVIKNRLVVCNTFLIHTSLFEKMMKWLIQYYREDVNINRHGLIGNAGEIIEALIGMFLSLEVSNGAKYYKFDVEHIWPLYKNIANKANNTNIS